MLLKAEPNYLKNKWIIGINVAQLKLQVFSEKRMCPALLREENVISVLPL